MSFEKTLKKLLSDELSKEGITSDTLKMVDLEIGFSPVIQFPGSKPVEALKCKGKKYIVNKTQIVDEDVLKIMRARFLINRRNPFVR